MMGGRAMRASLLVSGCQCPADRVPPLVISASATISGV